MDDAIVARITGWWLRLIGRAGIERLDRTRFPRTGAGVAGRANLSRHDRERRADAGRWPRLADRIAVEPRICRRRTARSFAVSRCGAGETEGAGPYNPLPIAARPIQVGGTMPDGMECRVARRPLRGRLRAGLCGAARRRDHRRAWRSGAAAPRNDAACGPPGSGPADRQAESGNW
jgi:hypothetical protein